MSYVYFILFCAAIIPWVLIPARKKEKEKKHQERLETIARIIPDVKTAFQDISRFFSYSHYLTESERKALENKYKPLFEDVATILQTKELEECPEKENILRFHKALSDTVTYKKANNEHFIHKELARCKEYFDTVLAYPLDTQQREAVVSLEDNVLVISSAGSGKTMTTVGKVRYLIDIQHVPAEKILLITFTRKAAESLSRRLGEKDLKCRTFHKLALDIIGEATGEKPSITNDDFSVQVYHQLFQENSDFRSSISDYIVRARYKMRDMFEYSSMQEYIQDRKKYGVQSYFKDMDGRPVFCKSDEESQICDFLGSRGIKFRYEEKYEHPTSNSEHRQYYPDFSIYIGALDGHLKRIYLEHFAVNENGRCPAWFSSEEEINYQNGIEWKRMTHKKNGTILLETTSAGFHRGDVFDSLAQQLKALGVVFKPAEDQDFSRELKWQEESIVGMLTSFYFLLKSKDMSLEEILRRASIGPDRITIKKVVTPFIEAYRRMEEERHEIDFTDTILRATALCNNGHRPDYDYILVDEFQDISLDRYHFLQALRKEKPQTKLFCVGDDWQSIYRFAGSDMALFKHFDEYFGYTKKCLMETTYRFGEPAIRKSSKFILANPEQAVKHVRPFLADSETSIEFISTQDRTDIVEKVKLIVDQIPENQEVLLLGRYSFDIKVFNKSELTVHESGNRPYVTYGNRKMNFMTVHQSKGLEADNVILLNCNSGTMGFPADIADSPVLKYVLSEPDAYAFSEERRVFYVGITRAKKHTWVLYDEKNPSPFVKEFIHPHDSEDEEKIPDSERCPKCHCGRILVVKRGVAVNGNPYTVEICSNKKLGCDYFNTTFVNLNEPRKAYAGKRTSVNGPRRRIGFK